MRKVTLIALSLVGVVAAALFLTPNSWFYQDRRPTRLGKAVNRAWTWAASLGVTPSAWPGEPRIGTIALEVRGRLTGALRSNVVTWVELGGERYLVSMLGERAEWVRNVRAAGGRAVIRHGGREPVFLEEVLVDQRAPVLKAYLKRTALSTRQHLGLEPEAPLSEFQRIAPTHPVFHITRPVSQTGVSRRTRQSQTPVT